MGTTVLIPQVLWYQEMLYGSGGVCCDLLGNSAHCHPKTDWRVTGGVRRLLTTCPAEIRQLCLTKTRSGREDREDVDRLNSNRLKFPDLEIQWIAVWEWRHQGFCLRDKQDGGSLGQDESLELI